MHLLALSWLDPLWDVKNREVISSGTRGETPLTEVLIARSATRVPLPWSSDTSRDTSPIEEEPAPPPRLYAPASAAARRSPLAPAARPGTAQSPAAKPRPELDYGTRPGAPGCAPPERCAHCAAPMPDRLRPEARYCSERCRQAASRTRLTSPPASG
jgi:hypothetical protein